MAKILETKNEIVEVDPTSVLGSIHFKTDDLKTSVMKLSDTSKKIRYLHSQGKSVGEIYKLLKEYGVTTKEKGEIRYQHVRNVVMTRLSK